MTLGRMARPEAGIKPRRSAASAALAPTAPTASTAWPALALPLAREGVGTDVAKRGFHGIRLTAACTATALTACAPAGPALTLASRARLTHVEARLRA
jgi:hypothetical protein